MRFKERNKNKHTKSETTTTEFFATIQNRKIFLKNLNKLPETKQNKKDL